MRFTSEVLRAILSSLVLVSVCLGIGVPGVSFAGVEYRFETRVSGIHIISIGIDKYDAPELADQRYAVADAVSLANELVEGVEASGERIAQGKKTSLPSTIIAAGSGKVVQHVLKDADVTWENMALAFDRVAADINPEDIFVFSFAGLGRQIGNEFVFFTSKAAGWSSKAGGISSSELQVLFRKIRAKNKLIILDSCDSTVGFSALESSFIEPNEKLRNGLDTNVLFIGSETTTYELPTIQHGILTQVVLEGIRGEADSDRDGVVTARELKGFMPFGVLRYRSPNEVIPKTTGAGDDFNISFSQKKREELKIAKRAAAKTPDRAAIAKRRPLRAEVNGEEAAKNGVPPRDGDDYALLFANEKYDNPAWQRLKNPVNDARDIAAELKERYGFKEVVIKENLPAEEILATLEEYKKRTFTKTDDQLFLFFAGHGATLKVSERQSDSYFVGRSSPESITRQNQGQFLKTDDIMSIIGDIKIAHVMTVFDTCYAGQIWKPAGNAYELQSRISEPRYMEFGRGIGKRSLLNEILLDDSLIFAKGIMSERTDIVLTSGDRPVLDAFELTDGSLSRNSPFAFRFLEKLRTGGQNFGVLTSSEIYTAVLGELVFSAKPIRVRRGGATGDFVFVQRDGKTKAVGETK